MNELINRVIVEGSGNLIPVPAKQAIKIKKLTGVKCILFDIYGTLLISGCGELGTDIHAESSEHKEQQSVISILRKCGLSIDGDEVNHLFPDILKSHIQIKHKKLRSQGIDYPEIDIRDIWQEVVLDLNRKKYMSTRLSADKIELLAISYEMFVNPVALMPGFPEIIHVFKQKGLKMGIVSNAQFFTTLILEAQLSDSLWNIGFEKDLCSWSFKSKYAKPSTKIFSEPLNILSHNYSIEPDEIAYVGNDMLNDVSTAQKCGCKTVLFAGDARSLRLRKDIEGFNAKPDAIIDDLMQLERIIIREGNNDQKN